MNDSVRRPFYAEYAWAFNVLIDRPVRKECATMVAWLVERGVLPGAELLDAGCGTGRHAAELARRGYVVHGIDLSPELIDVARQASDGERVSVSFAIGDIECCQPIDSMRFSAAACSTTSLRKTIARPCLPLSPRRFDLEVCSSWTCGSGRLRRRARRVSRLFRKSVATWGKLTFSSVTELDPENRRLLLSERHTLVDDGQELSSDYQFVMRCWTLTELQSGLASGGFSRVAYLGAYDDAVEAGRTDRLVAVAQL